MSTFTPNYNLEKPEASDPFENFRQSYNNNMDEIDRNLGGGGGSANIVELTQAEYDALPDSKLSDDTMYLIKDLNSASDAEFTHVYGFYIDETNKLFEGTMTNFTQTLEYTATEDAIALVDYSGSSGTNQWFLINNVIIPFQVLSSGRDSFTVPIRKGDKISARHSSDNEGCYFHLVVYGVKTGSEITIIPDYASACYSTQEREVGCWIDGKPLYQKSYVISPTTISENQWFSLPSIDVTGFETIVKTELHLGQGEKANNNYGFGRVNNGTFQIYIPYVALIVNIITLRYTKTADVAGSGNWTPLGKPTVHYSTEEQVIGTWINGKPLYQKTVTFTAQSGGYQNVALGVSNADMMYISEAYIISNIETAVLSSYTGNVANEEFQGLIAGLTTFDYRCGSDLNGGAGMVTVRYTKSTD